MLKHFTEFHEAVRYIKDRGWETLFYMDSETTGQPIVPYISVKISEELSLQVVLNDTYYIQIQRKGVDNISLMISEQVKYSPEGNLTTSKDELNRLKEMMSERDGSLFSSFVKDLYYFFKPNSVNFTFIDFSSTASTISFRAFKFSNASLSKSTILSKSIGNFSIKISSIIFLVTSSGFASKFSFP